MLRARVSRPDRCMSRAAPAVRGRGRRAGTGTAGPTRRPTTDRSTMGAISGAMGPGTPRRSARAQTLPKENTNARAAMMRHDHGHGALSDPVLSHRGSPPLVRRLGRGFERQAASALSSCARSDVRSRERREGVQAGSRVRWAVSAAMRAASASSHVRGADAGEAGAALVCHGGDADVGGVLEIDRVGVRPVADVLTERGHRRVRGLLREGQARPGTRHG